uniref:Beta-defensin n=1 Tax=Prolemur simus TaxID=1328070 RepID=A0A8C9DF62_PROSS
MNVSLLTYATNRWCNNPLLCPARGEFKEICERPNGSCQEFCLETEIHVGRCLNKQHCCLALGHHPGIESTTPDHK